MRDEESPLPGADARLLLPALCAWAAALAAGSREYSAALVGVLMLVSVGAGLVCRTQVFRHADAVCRPSNQHKLSHTPERRRIAVWLGRTGCVALAASLAVLVSSTARQTLLCHDPLLRARQTKEYVTVVVHADSPPLASVRRGSDCQYEASALAVRRAGIAMASRASVWVFASGRACAVGKGGLVRMRAQAGPAGYGQADVWLTTAASAGAWILPGKAGPFAALDSQVTRLWSAFFMHCRALPLQGRLLVPGMTIGVLGSQAFVGGRLQATSGEQDQADRLKKLFKSIGIVHLLAVSGGHFALIGGWVRRRLGCAGVPVWLRGTGVAIADLLLSALLFPADSVTRAVVMALISCLALGLGRPAQSLSALCLTVLLLLIARPALARSLGFALSCAAVLGILLLAAPLTRLLGRLRMPQAIASPLAMTLAAQLFTLPLQMLMGPVPDWRSIPANLLTTPFVDAATFLGLLSLVTCRPMPAVGQALARAASVPTGVIVLIATWLEGL